MQTVPVSVRGHQCERASEHGVGAEDGGWDTHLVVVHRHGIVGENVDDGRSCRRREAAAAWSLTHRGSGQQKETQVVATMTD
jgi:hypothetical protein